MVWFGQNPGCRDSIPPGSPFDPGNDAAYRCWRDRKLDGYPVRAEDLMVEIRDPFALTPTEREELLRCARKTNTVLYACAGDVIADKSLPMKLGQQLGLKCMDANLCADEDRVTSLRMMPGGTRHETYIPYTDRPLNWHTDGYYNTEARRIRAMLLHCVSDAAKGGENALLDHEVAYILLRDENPGYIAALMHPDAMTVPANVENGAEIRRARRGPVFLVDERTGALHMRYTARKRNIAWRQDPLTQAAARFLDDLFADGSGYILRHRLEPGQGIISNNALHNRSGFGDDPESGKTRLIYRARYYDRIRGTEFGATY